MEILIYALIVNVLIGFKLWWDWRAKNIKKRIINHSLSAAIDGLLYTISAWFLFGWDSGGWIVLAIGYRWLIFDIVFNLINNWEWNHYGSSSKLDKFLLNLGDFHLVPKLVTLLLGVIIINEWYVQIWHFIKNIFV